MQVRSRLPAGVDGWGYSLKGMMGMVVLGGLLITATYWGLQRTVVPKVQAGQPKKKKSKPNMGVGESFRFLAKSPYIRDLALLVRGGTRSLRSSIERVVVVACHEML